MEDIALFLDRLGVHSALRLPKFDRWVNFGKMQKRIFEYLFNNNASH